MDLFSFDQHSPTNEFFDSLSSHMLLSHIVQPTKIRNNSKSLTDNIYSNVITPNNISSNLATTIFLNIFERDWSKYDQENFVLDYLPVD